MSQEADVPTRDYPRKVLFVAGPDSGGTSTLAGIMQMLGVHLPQPEAPADGTDLTGFAEPEWMVNFHNALLSRAEVEADDARPDAWYETAKVTTRDEQRIKAATWLEEQFGFGPELVIKDPRLTWFLGMWRIAAVRTGAIPVYATVLQSPAEMVGGSLEQVKQLGPAHVAASWVNLMLGTERATREREASGGRAFVRYADLLDDWTKVTKGLADRLDIQHVIHASSVRLRDVHHFIGSSPRPVTHELSELGLPSRLEELTVETLRQLDALVDPDGDTREARANLDMLREGYIELYGDAESIAASSAAAAKLRGSREVRKEWRQAREAEAQARAEAQAKAEQAAPPQRPSDVAERVRGRVREVVRRLR